jgi:hypothetical protein
MIEIHLRSLPDRSWHAWTVINGRRYQTNAPAAAGNKLAKILRQRGILDQEMALINPTGNEALQTTLYAWADFRLKRQ